jgi:hypothetical protein
MQAKTARTQSGTSRCTIREATSCAVTREIRWGFFYPSTHATGCKHPRLRPEKLSTFYGNRIHKSSSIVPLLRQTNPVNASYQPPNPISPRCVLNIINPTYVFVLLVASFALVFPPITYTRSFSPPLLTTPLSVGSLLELTSKQRFKIKEQYAAFTEESVQRLAMGLARSCHPHEHRMSQSKYIYSNKRSKRK